jgi:hypothetical protein
MPIERQHYIPQGFLKSFTISDETSDKFIWVYEKLEGRKPRRASIKSIAWEPYYYEQESEFGEKDPDTLEIGLARTIDSVAPEIIRSIVARPGRNADLSTKDKGTLAFFLGLLMTRVPSFREPIKDLHSGIAQQALEQLLENGQVVPPPIGIGEIQAEAKSWVSLRPMIQTAKVIGESVLRKYWQCFVPPKGFSLITSDNPVTFHVSREYGAILAGPAHPLAEIVVNLRKDLALVCTPRQKEGSDFSVFRMSTKGGRKFNRGTAIAARRFVFADVQSDDIERLVKKYRDSEQTIEIG